MSQEHAGGQPTIIAARPGPRTLAILRDGDDRAAQMWTMIDSGVAWLEAHPDARIYSYDSPDCQAFRLTIRDAADDTAPSDQAFAANAALWIYQNDRATFDAMVAATPRRQCTCDIIALMAGGCRCGGA